MGANYFPVGWFEIYVQDMARAKQFYEAVFEITLEGIPGGGPEMWMFPKREEQLGCPGALVKMEGKSSGPGGTIIYFSCMDCAVEAKRAADAGGEIHREKFGIPPHGFISFIHDTEGNLIGLHSMQ